MQATKQEVLEVYTELAKLLPKNSIIAGGCPRDLYFGKPYKDVDIFAGTNAANGKTKYFNFSKFVEYEIPKNFGVDVNKTKFFKNEFALEDKDFDDYQGGLNCLDCVIDVTINDTKYQMIFVRTNSIQAYVNDCFDFNFNQIILDGSGLTLLNGFNSFLTSGRKASFCVNEVERSKYLTTHHLSRIERFSKKYPEFDFTDVTTALKEVQVKSIPVKRKGAFLNTYQNFTATTTNVYATFSPAPPNQQADELELFDAFWLVGGNIYYKYFTNGQREYKNYSNVPRILDLSDGHSVTIEPNCSYFCMIDPHASML